MKNFLKQKEKIKKIFRNSKNRKKFWEENKKNFEKNIKELFDVLKKKIKVDKKWRIYIAGFNFISSREIKPYSYDSFSSTNLIAANEEQGFEIGIFFNKARLGFLSKLALIPIMLHELKHVEQAAKNPEEYSRSMFDDEISEKLEREAESEIEELDEFRKQEVLESILFCLDLGGWREAEEMAEFWHKKIEKIYGKGYEKMMKEKEHRAFLEAKRAKDINRLIDLF